MGSFEDLAGGSGWMADGARTFLNVGLFGFYLALCGRLGCFGGGPINKVTSCGHSLWGLGASHVLRASRAGAEETHLGN